MADAHTIMATNALGKIHGNDAFLPVLEEGSCLVDIASRSAYLVPKWICPKGHYPLCRKDKRRFMEKMMKRVQLFPRRLQAGMSYVISKDFAIRFARTDAARFGDRGIRVLSISPGNFDTPMARAEKERASTYVDHCAIKRFGKVDEIAHLLAACVDPKMGCLTGTDILVDGGCAASGYGPLRSRLSRS
jgi:NAD(P)-dependent dehydrogenase (short-subunit alcohol dehydrogenase family)